MITFKHKGSFRNTEKLFKAVEGKTWINKLQNLAIAGVNALSANTPVDTGLTASSWVYEIVNEPGRVSIVWSNTNVNNYVNIAMILQYGHATRNGGWVEGRDYINPALQPIFDAMASEAWEVITKE